MRLISEEPDNGIQVVALGDLDVLEAKLVDEGGDNDLTDGGKGGGEEEVGRGSQAGQRSRIEDIGGEVVAGGGGTEDGGFVVSQTEGKRSET